MSFRVGNFSSMPEKDEFIAVQSIHQEMNFHFLEFQRNFTLPNQHKRQNHRRQALNGPPKFSRAQRRGLPTATEEGTQSPSLSADLTPPFQGG